MSAKVDVSTDQAWRERPPWPVLPWLTSGLSVAGLLVASYLTIAHYTSPHVLVCSDTGLINCTKVTTSPQSVVLGVPVAVLGVAYFLTLFALCLPVSWNRPSSALAVARLAFVTTGIGFVLYLVGTELLVLGVICLWCTVVHVIQFVLFFSVVAGTVVRWPFLNHVRQNDGASADSGASRISR